MSVIMAILSRLGAVKLLSRGELENLTDWINFRVGGRVGFVQGKVFHGCSEYCIITWSNKVNSGGLFEEGAIVQYSYFHSAESVNAARGRGEDFIGLRKVGGYYEYYPDRGGVSVIGRGKEDHEKYRKVLGH
jgi:hypothetical protein